QQVGREANTLQGAIRTLDVSQKKLSSEISLAENNIGKSQLSIESLGNEIGKLEDDIHTNTNAIAQTIREIDEADDISMIESMLTSIDISSVWENIDMMEKFQESISQRIVQLRNIQQFLGQKKTETEKQRKELLTFKSTLADKKVLVEHNKKEKSTLLTQTKSKEAEYKNILAAKAAERAAFEKELFEYELQLQKVIDTTKIAPAGKGVFAWPVDMVRVTQYFGRTADAKRLYTSGTHNGIDLGVPRGTPIKASLTGVVTAIGNTDEQASCYSYGKWALIKHNNGLSTLYAHLDLHKVSPGETVATGQVIGYSGMTGYATGPHLHFTVYATEGVTVQRYASSINCKNVSIPIAGPNAYLDPMLYLQ
ncbi:peptidoglycan DD-metalloendopeptidase family protein, partial [Candidatus Parcubacteria bacterium]|nr:peptidoglycan DD-metalloendopeptidase family protein [Candidatus Parcubacteria bacterium]